MKNKKCPLGHACDECLWLVNIRGLNPQTGQEVDQVGCAVSWIPLLLVENSQQQRQTAASVDSLREVVRSDNLSLTKLITHMDLLS
jgi:hypothetical protein